jgi:NRPS condensation-like uncharacterized protein
MEPVKPTVPAAWLRPNLVDRLMLRLEEIGQNPLTFHVFLELDGDLDRAALAAALGDTIADFPMLATRVRRTAWGYRRHAVDPGAADPATLVAWKPGAGPDGEAAFVNDPLDVATSPPIRLLAVPHGAGTRLVAKVHHAAMDGVGAFLWLAQLASRYGERLEGRPPAPAPAPGADRSYAQYVRALSWRERLVVLSRGAHALTGFFIGGGTGTGGPNADYATFLDRPLPTTGDVRWAVARLDAARVATLKAWTRARGGTMNDLLFAAFATTAATRWPNTKPVVAHIPVNLRTGVPEGVFNRVADVRVELAPGDLTTFEAAYRATVDVTPAARDRFQAIARIFERWLVSHFPRRAFGRLVGTYMRRPRNGVMTFDFSNIGVHADLVGDFGPAKVAGGWLVGPQSSPPGLGCYVTTIRGELAIAVGHLAPCMAEASAAALAEDVRALLAGLAAPAETLASR